jgi:hypothetical protein
VIAGGVAVGAFAQTLPAEPVSSKTEIERQMAQALVGAPSWCPKPSEVRYYPRKAEGTGARGRVVLTCDIADDRRLMNCQIVSEEPKTYDFGVSARMMAECLMRAPPGKASPVTFPMTFQPG